MEDNYNLISKLTEQLAKDVSAKKDCLITDLLKDMGISGDPYEISKRLSIVKLDNDPMGIGWEHWYVDFGTETEQHVVSIQGPIHQTADNKTTATFNYVTDMGSLSKK